MPARRQVHPADVGVGPDQEMSVVNRILGPVHRVLHFVGPAAKCCVRCVIHRFRRRSLACVVLASIVLSCYRLVPDGSLRVGDPQFHANATRVVLYRIVADAEFPGDLLVQRTLGSQVKHLMFAWAQGLYRFFEEVCVWGIRFRLRSADICIRGAPAGGG